MPDPPQIPLLPEASDCGEACLGGWKAASSWFCDLWNLITCSSYIHIQINPSFKNIFLFISQYIQSKCPRWFNFPSCKLRWRQCLRDLLTPSYNSSYSNVEKQRLDRKGAWVSERSDVCPSGDRASPGADWPAVPSALGSGSLFLLNWEDEYRMAEPSGLVALLLVCKSVMPPWCLPSLSSGLFLSLPRSLEHHCKCTARFWQSREIS